MATGQNFSDFQMNLEQYDRLLAEKMESAAQSVGTDEWVEEYRGQDPASVAIRTGIQRLLEIAEDLARDNPDALKYINPDYEDFPKKFKWYQRLRFAIRMTQAIKERCDEELEIAVFLMQMKVGLSWSLVASELLGVTRQAASKRYGPALEKQYLKMMMELMKEAEPEAFLAAVREALAKQRPEETP